MRSRGETHVDLMNNDWLMSMLCPSPTSIHNLQDNLQDLFWTQVFDLYVQICFIPFSSSGAHVQGKGALKSYLNSLFAQNLSINFSNTSRFRAATTSSGSLFHIFTILLVKENFLMSLLNLYVFFFSSYYHVIRPSQKQIYNISCFTSSVFSATHVSLLVVKRTSLTLWHFNHHTKDSLC